MGAEDIRGNSSSNPESVQVVGSNLAEQQTQADASAGTLTFAANFEYVEIYNTDGTNAGTFTVNGITINVPAGKSYGPAGIAGTPAATVTVTGATTYIVNRYT